jgi:ATP-dependent DNA ligase
VWRPRDAGWRVGRAEGRRGVELPRAPDRSPTGRDDKLFFYVFDLLHLNGWDLRGCTLLERKCVLAGLTDWTDMLRYSDHHIGEAAAMRRRACAMRLEGIV